MLTRERSALFSGNRRPQGARTSRLA
jgi:hypothetical protein